MKAIIVTGGAGFIGSAVVRELLAVGYSVINYDALTYAGNTDTLLDVNQHPHYRFVHGSICDSRKLKEIFIEYRPISVINLAAETHVDRSIDGPEEFIQTNVVGTLRLLETAREYHKSINDPERDQFQFLHVSTDEVFGELADTGLFTETTPYAPQSPYAASKAASDHLVRAWGNTYELPIKITNCSNNYGPFHFPEKLIPLTILNAIKGKRLPVYGDGSNVRDWLFVTDHAQAILAVLEKGALGNTYNIGGETQKTNLEVVNAICDQLNSIVPRENGCGYEELIEFVADRPGHDYRYAMDIAKIRKELGWTPQYSFEQGISETVNWYLNNSDWCQIVASGGYDQQRLGLGSVVS